MATNLLIAMIGLPLAGAILNGLIVRSRSVRQSGVIATVAAFLSFVCAVLLFKDLLETKQPVTFSMEWFSAGALRLNWGFAFDQLTAAMALFVTGVGSLIHLYSIGYMHGDPGVSRYFAYLNLFLFAMLVLICGSNVPVLFVGWEGVGLCSYLLIGFWFKDIEKANAGMKAFIVNRIGDAGFLIGIFILFSLFESVDFATMRTTVAGANDLDLRTLSIAAFFLFVGAMGKSAQIPLFVWLPDAMAGPTPVSALIHAATMVTAGIYLVLRMAFLFQVTPDTSLFISVIGVSTALLAAFIATSQRDIKKVLAYSTVSQLGLMFLGLGQGAYIPAFFHVITHAFFKALLFLGAGSVIHALEGEQDICEMGGLRKKLPQTFWTFAIGTFAICGIPPLSGFFSKDALLFGVKNGPYGEMFWALGSFASFLTAFYMCRLFGLVFLGSFRGPETKHPHESPALMTIPLWVLALGSATAGILSTPHALHLAPDYLAQWLTPLVPAMVLPEGFEVAEKNAMIVATALAVLGSSIGLWLFSDPRRSEKPAGVLKPVIALFANKFWIDELYAIVIVRPFERSSRMLARIFDVYVIDGAVLLPSKLARGGGMLLSFVQTGSSQLYLLVMLLGALGVFWFCLKGVPV